MRTNTIMLGDCMDKLKELNDNSIDLIVTDPPYGLEFMGKDWDRAVPDVNVWKECHRVLKHGSFLFVMSSPRLDCLSQMTIRIQDAGFRVDFTPIFWAYASGFPKASNISKMVDKRGYENERYSELSKELCDYLKTSRNKLKLSMKDIATHFPSRTGGLTGCVWNWENGANIPTMKQWNKLKEILNLDNQKFIELIERAILKREEAEREIVGQKDTGNPVNWYANQDIKPRGNGVVDVTIPSTPQAKVLDGSYGGFQPKPAVEIIIVAMKPLSEKTFVDQALKNRKGISWLDDCRIPINPEIDDMLRETDRGKRQTETWENGSGFKNENNPFTGVRQEGRFPANLLVSDDVLDDGNVTSAIRSHRGGQISSASDVYSWNKKNKGSFNKNLAYECGYDDTGSFSRYFDLSKWFSENILKLPKNVKKTFPFMIVPKASKGEKDEGCEEMEEQHTPTTGNGIGGKPHDEDNPRLKHNVHPTVKPVQLMTYLITLGSRPHDIILDPFIGSGTTAIACRMINRKFIGIEMSKEYHDIAQARLKDYMEQKKLWEVVNNKGGARK